MGSRNLYLLLSSRRRFALNSSQPRRHLFTRLQLTPSLLINPRLPSTRVKMQYFHAPTRKMTLRPDDRPEQPSSQAPGIPKQKGDHRLTTPSQLQPDSNPAKDSRKAPASGLGVDFDTNTSASSTYSSAAAQPTQQSLHHQIPSRLTNADTFTRRSNSDPHPSSPSLNQSTPRLIRYSHEGLTYPVDVPLPEAYVDHINRLRRPTSNDARVLFRWYDISDDWQDYPRSR